MAMPRLGGMARSRSQCIGQHRATGFGGLTQDFSDLDGAFGERMDETYTTAMNREAPGFRSF